MNTVLYKILYEPSPSGVLIRTLYSHPLINRMNGKVLKFVGIGKSMDIVMSFTDLYKQNLGFYSKNLFVFNLLMPELENYRRLITTVRIPDSLTLSCDYYNIFVTYLLWGVSAALMETKKVKKSSQKIYEVIHR